MTSPPSPERRTGAGAAAALEALPRGGPLPPWCDRHLPPARRDALGGRAWYDTTLAAGMPPDAEAVLALGAGGAVLMPLSSGFGADAVATRLAIGGARAILTNRTTP